MECKLTETKLPRCVDTLYRDWSCWKLSNPGLPLRLLGSHSHLNQNLPNSMLHVHCQKTEGDENIPRIPTLLYSGDSVLSNLRASCILFSRVREVTF